MGPLDIGEMGPSDQPICHCLLNRADCVHGISPISTRKCRKHELCKFDLWRSNAGEHYHVVCIREENLLGASEGGH